MRRKIVAANWKMNLTLSEVQNYLNVFKAGYHSQKQEVEVVINPPFPYLSLLKDALSQTDVKVGAQTVSEYEQGAYTGEVSGSILSSLGINYCIIGHSERRKYFNERNDQLAIKLSNALKYKLTPIFCCGELLEQRQDGTHFQTVLKQLQESLYHLDSDSIQKVVIAYEPVWAIGTGVVATTHEAQEMHRFIRNSLGEHYGKAAANAIAILYGGSCTSSNAAELFSCPDVDGGLIGGASLKPTEFIQIISIAGEKRRLS